MTKFSKNHFLFSALLLVSRSVLGRGETSQHRQVTMAPTESNNSGAGKGMKSEKSFVPTESNSSGKGKGMRSEKSSKSVGKALKSLKSEEGIGLLLDKKSKKDSKSEKRLKKEKDGKLGIKFPSTPSPTSTDSISSKSSTFAITYSATTHNPSPDDFEELAMVTQKYLEDFMMDFFDKTALTDLDNFLTRMDRNIFVAGEPIIAEYQSNGLFNPDSIFIPVARELDNLIQDAISQDEYLNALYDLPRSNPLRGTNTIAFTEPSSSTSGGESTSSSSSESSSIVQAGVGAAAAGVLVLAAGLALLKTRRPSLDNEDDDVQSFSPDMSIEEDTTHTGKACAVPETDHSFAHWRTAKSYNDGIDAGEFQDEPLDS